IDAVNEYGDPLQIAIPAERALTVYVDKRELVTLMTLGAHPELLVLGYLRNQRLVKDATDIESITVDWDVGAAAVKTRHGIVDIEEKTARKVVTTGCGQGSVFGGLMDEVDQIELPGDACITQAQLYGLVNTIRLKETTYKSAGSVHACALFSLAAAEPEMLLFVEDVGRHNAIDTIAGWMAMNMAPTLVASRTALPPEGALRLRPGEAGSAALAGEEGAPTLPTGVSSLPPEGAAAPADWQSQIRGLGWSGSEVPTLSHPPSGLVFYTTGRLTSEMVIKSAQMGVPIVVSRSGITQMGHQVAQAVGLCAIGRATNRRFVCYAQPHRLKLQPDLAGPRLRAPETA
ncbi:MAG: formate dehydrogenase accessory sulfurtransferase FdhD, partial [Polaromonas sp.]|nr:formate dehydrogenase accessory sulfurtransferase FdhD [Polaromonas sp.]